MNQRLWLGSLVIVASAIAGGLWFGQRYYTKAPPPVAAAPLPEFWNLQFERPEGGRLTLESLRGRPLVINFWATWCPPCVREMPELDRFARDSANHGWQVIGLAVDSPTPVREFLKALPVNFPVGLVGLGGTELSRQLGNTSGALPFTVLIDASGQVVQRKLGQTSHEELLHWTRSSRP